jgi:hypothetical protein
MTFAVLSAELGVQDAPMPFLGQTWIPAFALGDAHILLALDSSHAPSRERFEHQLRSCEIRAVI